MSSVRPHELGAVWPASSLVPRTQSEARAAPRVRRRDLDCRGDVSPGAFDDAGAELAAGTADRVDLGLSDDFPSVPPAPLTCGRGSVFRRRRRARRACVG